MKRFKLFVILFVMSIFAHQAQAKILVEDGNSAKSTVKKTAASGLELRRLRRVGVGAAAAGSLGLGGVNLELNINSKTGFIVGYGGGSNYSAFSFEMKKVLSGEWLLPYMSFGLARWYNTQENDHIDKTGPSFLADRFMTESDRRNGNIDEFLLFPAFGLQYMQLNGPWAGHSMYAQVQILLDIGDFEAAPTGSIGYLYYF
jgi:hypothetical protein